MKNKENSTLNYTLSSSSFPFFWVVKTENYFTILTLFIYTVKEIGPNPKKLQVGFPKESLVYCPRSRPRVDVATWISLVCSCSIATLLRLLQPDSLQLLGLMVGTSFMVATLLAQGFSRVDVATTVSRSDFVFFLFVFVLSHDLSSESGLFSLLRCMLRLRF